MILGAHVSISGGLYKCFQRGEEIGADAIQIFTKNATQWKAKTLTDSDIERFRLTWKNSKIKKVIAHGSYLINLAHPGKDEWRKAVDAFQEEIERVEKLEIPWLVMHPGSAHGSSDEDAIKRISDALNESFDRTKGYKSGVLVETMSGQGSGIGWRFEHLKKIMELVRDKERIGVCVDTAHIFAAGYNLSTKSGYMKVFREFSNIIGLSRLKAIHLNESMKQCCSRIDRHANIGDGEIGLDAFRFIVNDKRFTSIPMILETPGGDVMFKRNLKILRSLSQREL